MTLKIDRAGRVILPKPVRDRLGLHAGSDLEIQETADGVMLKPADRRPSLIRKGGFLVHAGEIPTAYDILKAIDEDREGRMRKAWGTLNWYFDTSVLVAAAVDRHPHNAPALALLEELVNRKYRGSTSAHSLTEVYSVLTRTPFNPPLYPSEAWLIIECMILPHMELVTLTGREYKEVVHQCALNGWAGGRVHDAVHLRCAQKASCDRIYTFNVKDFRLLAPSGLGDKVSAP